ncbi:hypothetical protein BDF20DRAFT_175105 [Mycotypha africana]|uniref:uncharacterized protein n=1 Tax=Mycotypha africana TaxID=64632 RepID=UPI0023015981|nr:uncharacterized protein BDF20DRAFT_175105 [Mycotypha africana]KAI8968336.1 hypothetical protein BDF20DRAFT_175105 [Mycotypha africana]
MFPIWAVIIIAVIVVILLIAGILCLKRRKTRSLSVNTLNKLAGEDDIEKKTIFTESNQSVIVSEKVHKQPQQRLVQQQSTITNASTVIAATVPTAVVSQLSKSNIANNDTSNNSDIESSSEEPIIADSIEENKVNEYRHYDEEDAEVHMAPDPPQEIIISLPLPPPSTSFFSDKMELGDASHDENESGTANEDLYALYSKLLNKDAKRNSYLQQKAATIKSTLRKQSLRLQPHKSTAHFRSSLQNIFASNTSSDAPSDGRPLVTDTCTRKTESNANKKQPEPKVQTLSDSTKVIINMAPSAHSASAFEGQPSPINVAAAPEVIATDEATPNFLNENTRLQEDERFPTAARNSAMRVIRSASIKAKTRSMIIDKSKLSALDFVEDENDSRNKVLRQNSMTQFTTTTPTRKKGEFMTITSGSVRRLVRDSVVTQKSEPAFAFTAREKPERKSMNVMDIAGYWDNHHKKQQASLQQRSSSLDYSTAIQQQHLQQQADRNSVDDDHTVSNKAHGSHYKASLSNSVFDTLSKGKFNPAVAATHALPDEPKNDNKTSTTSGRLLARHGSLKKGATLSRNTLKFIKNSATQGVNRSLKGLFDTNTADNLSTTTTTSSFSPKPDDSQKMELTPSESESALTDIQTVAKEKVMLVKSQQQQVLDPVYHSRTNTQETDFSSNKLALGEGGDVNTPDESSKKTAIDDDEDQIDVMYASRDSSYYFGVTEEEVLDLAVADNRSSAQQLSYQNISEAMQDTADVNTTTANSTGEVEDIRRMLQETWLKNIRESGSSYSMLSEATTSAGNNNVPTSP